MSGCKPERVQIRIVRTFSGKMQSSWAFRYRRRSFIWRRRLKSRRINPRIRFGYDGSLFGLELPGRFEELRNSAQQSQNMPRARHLLGVSPAVGHPAYETTQKVRLCEWPDR